MIYLITGGSGSGKSAYAEQLMTQFSGTKYYIATMQVYDREGEQKIARHRRLREGKGFLTIEQPSDIGEIVIRTQGSAALLECMSNLVANEMFSGAQIKEYRLVEDKVAAEVRLLAGQLEQLVIVTNNVFEDGIQYESATMDYMKALGEVNREIAGFADQVTEVVVGIPVSVKEALCPC